MRKETIRKIISNQDRHARWLNTLAFLEYIGSRKILKSQNENSLTLEVLTHIAEEARHALFFKRILAKQFPNTCQTFEEQYLLGDPNRYFQSLDEKVSENLGARELTYGYVTLLIEERALEVYQAYQECLDEAGISISLKSILNEEQRHLTEIRTILQQNDSHFEDRLNVLKTIEGSLFSEFSGGIQESIEKGGTNEISDLEAIHSNGVTSQAQAY